MIVLTFNNNALDNIDNKDDIQDKDTYKLEYNNHNKREIEHIQL